MKYFLLGLGLMVIACSVEQDTVSPVVLPIEETPMLPFPLNSEGLSFKTGLGDSQGPALGDACIGADGTLFASIPSWGLLARFAAPEYEGHYLGSQEYGGKGEPIGWVDQLQAVGSLLYMTQIGHAGIRALVNEGKVEANPDFEFKAPLFLGDGSFFSRTSGRVFQFYTAESVPGVKLEFPEGEWIVTLDPGGALIGIRRDGANQLVHFTKQGVIKSHWSWEQSTSAAAEALDLCVRDGFYWLLYRVGQQHMLLVIDEGGVIHHKWRLAMRADGLDVSNQKVLLFQRGAGLMQTFGRI